MFMVDDGERRGDEAVEATRTALLRQVDAAVVLCAARVEEVGEFVEELRGHTKTPPVSFALLVFSLICLSSYLIVADVRILCHGGRSAASCAGS